MALCQITITDNEDGEVSIEAAHEGQLDTSIKSHAALKSIMDMIPMMFSPADSFKPVPRALLRDEIEGNALAVDEKKQLIQVAS